MIEFLLILVAPAIGSFMGVVCDRFPRNEDVLILPSRCRSCSVRLKLWDLVPIVSYLVRKGSCSYCGRPIPVRDFIFEIAALMIAISATIIGATKIHIMTSCIFGWLLFLLGSIDWYFRRLPNFLTLSLFVIGYIASLALRPESILSPLIGSLVGGGIFWGIRKGYKLVRGYEGMGLGDVKLMAALGTWFEWQILPWIVLVSSFTALTYVLVYAKLQRRRVNKTEEISFGTFLCIGAWIVWVTVVYS